MHEKQKNIFNHCWAELDKGTTDSQNPFRYPVLATTDQSNWSDSRTIVLRDVIAPQNELIFFTDKRSPKVHQIKANNKASLLFYHHKKKLQLRTRGLIIELEDKMRIERYFNNISQTDLKDYRTLSAPGTLIKSGEAKWLPKDTASDYFSVLSFKAMSIDYLQLSKDGHKRFIFNFKRQEWKGYEIVP